MTPEQERLVVESIPAVENMARRFLSHVTATSVDREAVRSAALEGLVDAVSRSTGGATWPRYCRRKVIGKMRDELRVQDPAKNRSTTRDRVETKTVPLPAAYDREDGADAFAQARSRIDLLHALSSLPARQQYVVAMNSILDHALRGLADELRISESRVCNVRREAFVALRRRMIVSPYHAAGGA